ncbi:AAA family ATPase [Salinithrix halophila]|uniref:AAA family ATPase n=1 Tax=Salinithrix halophila TaxID=1485204 RepID=A0ABV8JHB1_9BACL
MPVTLHFPEKCLILLCSAPGCGKSTFASRHFLPTQVVSSDECRAMVCDDVNNMKVHGEAFSLLTHITRLRLGLGKMTVLDTTALSRDLRRRMVKLAREYGFQTTIIVLDFRLETCLGQNERRDRVVAPAVIRRYHQQLQTAKKQIPKEDFDNIHILTEEEIKEVQISLIQRT